jgi:hypothetical protein
VGKKEYHNVLEPFDLDSEVVCQARVMPPVIAVECSCCTVLLIVRSSPVKCC